MRSDASAAWPSRAALALALTACGGDDARGGRSRSDTDFAAGTTMAKLSEAGTVKIGVKFDQPGIGSKKPGADAPEGFDIEIAKIIAAKLGIEPGQDRVGRDRLGEPRAVPPERHRRHRLRVLLDHRRAARGRRPGRAVLRDGAAAAGAARTTTRSPARRRSSGKKVCSVTGSTSIKTVEEKYGAAPAPFATYTECVQQLMNGSVDAVTTDGAILLGYAAQQPDKLKVVGEPFSEERYGIGYKNDDAAMCKFLNDTLDGAFEDGVVEGRRTTRHARQGRRSEAPEPPTARPPARRRSTRVGLGRRSVADPHPASR